MDLVSQAALLDPLMCTLKWTCKKKNAHPICKLCKLSPCLQMGWDPIISGAKSHCWVTAKCVGAWVCAHVPYTETHRLALFTRYPNHEEEVSASKEGNVVKFPSPPIAAIMNSTWHMSKTPLSLSWKASLFWKKKWGAEWNACEEVSARTELAFLKLNTNIFSYQLDVPQPEHYSQN